MVDRRQSEDSRSKQDNTLKGYTCIDLCPPARFSLLNFPKEPKNSTHEPMEGISYSTQTSPKGKSGDSPSYGLHYDTELRLEFLNFSSDLKDRGWRWTLQSPVDIMEHFLIL